MEPAESSSGKTTASTMQSLFSRSSSEGSRDNSGGPGVPAVFSHAELRKATKDYKQVIGKGGYGTVYLGKLRDKRMVAVKVIYEYDEKIIRQFNSEVDLLSRLHHKNLIAFYGSTKPSRKVNEPLALVYEFVSNGTIASHLHDEHLPFIWQLRIQIAIETAEVLSYLHSMDPPIIHRDVKTENILLQNDFQVKLADFGLCRLLSSDQTDVFTVTPGTQGYQDPEYKRVFKVTNKSDVYSFGVVLLELISRQKAVDPEQRPNPEDIYLDEIALRKNSNNELEQLIDPKIGYHSDAKVKKIIDSVMELAIRCIQPTGAMRPSMKEVLGILKGIEYDTQDFKFYKAVRKRMDQKQGKEQSILQLFRRKKEQNDYDRRLEEFNVAHEGGSGITNIGTAHFFSYDELQEATDYFPTSQRLGRGGFGRVYSGVDQENFILTLEKSQRLTWNKGKKKGKKEIKKSVKQMTYSCLGSIFI